MGLFFMSVGMSIDMGLVLRNAAFLVALAIGVIVVKSLVVYGLMRASRSTHCESLSAAGVLTPAGEFSFVVFPLAASYNLLPLETANMLSAIAALTMVAGPLVANGIQRWSDRVRPAGQLPPAEIVPDGARGNVLVIGFGRFGQMVVQVLLRERVDVTVIDNDIERIRNAARFGFKVYFGDGTRLDVLRAAGAAEARVIAICVDKKDEALLIVEMIKQNFPLARVHVRAYDRIHAIALYGAGGLSGARNVRIRAALWRRHAVRIDRGSDTRRRGGGRSAPARSGAARHAASWRELLGCGRGSADHA